MLCPMMLNGVRSGETYSECKCLKEKCEWWAKVKKENHESRQVEWKYGCAIKLIAEKKP